MDLNPFHVAATGSPVTVVFPTDFMINLAFRDSQTGAVVLDFSGDKQIKMSELLGMMTADALLAFVAGTAPGMAELAGGLS